VKLDREVAIKVLPIVLARPSDSGDLGRIHPATVKSDWTRQGSVERGLMGAQIQADDFDVYLLMFA
jgi:hypothetical protein